MLASGDIFEHTVRHGEKRGMSEKYIKAMLAEHKIPLKDCDIVGVNALKSRFGDVKTIFITADKKTVEERLHKRGDKLEDIKQRLADYDLYMKNAEHYDHVLENVDLQKTIDKILEIIYN